MRLKEMFSRVKIVPVCVFSSPAKALKVSELLLRSGVDVIEVTLRTHEAFSCVEAISREFPDVLVGAGTVLDRWALERAAGSGAQFAVSPCFDEELLDRAEIINIPFVPGVCTPTELYKAVKRCSIIKVFPVDIMGGADYIRSIAAPFRMLDFHLVPTGGVNNSNFRNYLSMDKVLACGMTYPVNEKLINEEKFDLIENRIREIYGEVF